MKIKDVVKTTALLLGKEKLYMALLSENGIDSTDNEILALADVMTRLANLVITELATSYILMKKREKVIFNAGKFFYANLSETPLKILGVYDLNGNSYKYSQHHEYLTAPTSCAVIEYAYKPANYDLDSIIGYTELDVSLRTLALGLAAECCIVEGRFDEAVMWHKRFEESVEKTCCPKNATVKERSFV